ncbi:MAG: hypothetical protein ACI8RZ_004630 [Myxococcota bacterium]|jgi:hypothetical protein
MRTALALLVSALVGCAIPEPALTGVEPGVVCASQPAPLSLLGENLSPTIIGGLGEDAALYLPSVRLSQGDRAVEITGDDTQLRWVSDSELTLALDVGLAAGVWDVSVSRVDGSSASLTAALDALARPELDALTPASLCHARSDAPLHLSGIGIALVGSETPTVTVADQPTSVLSMNDCVVTGGPSLVSLCDSMDVEVDAAALPLGWVSVSLENPAAASCGAVTTTVEVRSPPSISAVSPEALCTDGGALVVTGEELRDDTLVTVGGVEAEISDYAGGTSMTVILPSGLPSGTHDVTVTSPGGCSDTLAAAVEVVSSPLAYDASPSSLPEGLSAEVSVYVANIIDEVVDVWLEDSVGASIAVDWQWDAAEGGEVVITIPDDLDVGEYSVGVSLAGACGGTSSAVLRIVEDSAVAVTSVAPSFAWTFDATPVEVFASDPTPADMEGFEETPTMVLIGETGVVRALTGVTHRSDARLTATIPAELEAGSYHLLVENPGGALGLLRDAVTVTTSAPPTISTVRPLSLSTSQDTTVTLSGQDFRDPEVWLECRDGDTTATVLSWSYGEITVEVSSSQLGQTVCLLHVVNSDETAARYASVSITNPSSNLFPWSAGTDLNIARRAPAVGAGRVDSVSRYLYALGGDSGDASSALSSIEQAEVGVFGDLGDWTVLTAALPGPRTLAGLGVIGRYLYLVGGDDGTGAVDAVWRAQILIPEEAPQLNTPSMFLGEDGLEEGSWQYAVSALYDAADELNPGGESLASERLTLQLPALSGDRYQPRLSWAVAEDAIGYRVYRSTGADAEDLGWIADVEETTLTDTGLSADGSTVPLTVGELGQWVPLASMTTPRSAGCLTIAADPSPDPERLYLYVAGGIDDSGVVLDSIERLDITVTSERSQTAGSWSLSDLTLSEARYACGAYTVSADFHTVVEPGEDWVFFAGGADTEDRATGEVDAGRVMADGELEDWQEVDGMSPARAGFGLASASDTLYAFGGQQFRTSAGGTSAEVTSPMPEISNWNSLGTSLSEARLLPGSAQESSVIFVVGGETDTAGATTSTDWTNY